jgi:hypothetical protein
MLRRRDRLGRGARRLRAATHPGWLILAGHGLAVLVLGVVTTTPGALASAAALEDRLEGD